MWHVETHPSCCAPPFLDICQINTCIQVYVHICAVVQSSATAYHITRTFFDNNAYTHRHTCTHSFLPSATAKCATFFTLYPPRYVCSYCCLIYTLICLQLTFSLLFLLIGNYKPYPDGLHILCVILAIYLLCLGSVSCCTYAHSDNCSNIKHN